ncbi:MAG: tRNA (5-methylaminomethyl-2-thiouridine)(34)-methyltransferase MnmD [Pseudomonadota bacterium]
MADASDQDGVDWRDGTPISRRFADPYFSLADGLAEVDHVFLGGNHLPERWAGAASARVAELGFGTGLSFLAARRLWRRLGAGRLHFTSFEAYPLTRAEMADALAPWPDLDAGPLLAAWPLSGPLDMGDVVLEIIPGDARATLAAWEGMAEAWFLDGFAPARNPELWEPDLLAEVARHTAPEGTFATYTAAGHVRRTLEAVGFAVERRPGFGRKRHMTAGRLVTPAQAVPE